MFTKKNLFLLLLCCTSISVYPYLPVNEPCIEHDDLECTVNYHIAIKLLAKYEQDYPTQQAFIKKCHFILASGCGRMESPVLNIYSNKCQKSVCNVYNLLTDKLIMHLIEELLESV